MDNLSIVPPVSPLETEEDKTLDIALRPQKWGDFIGQENVKKNLRIIIEAAKRRSEPPEHLLFYGNSGLGKTSLAMITAKELGTNIKITSGPAIERAGDLAAVLTNLSEGDVLFIDEIHRLNNLCEEIIYPALEDFKLHLTIGKGPMARTMELDLPKFTLIGATTRMAMLSSPLRSRFGATFQLGFYSNDNIAEIIRRSSQRLGTKIEPSAVLTIAKSSRFTPRVANRLLKRTRDFAQVEGQGIITDKIAKSALSYLEIDEYGLESGDRKILETIISKFNGGPVGLQALAASAAEDEETILDIYEPYLMQIGFIERTPRGRMATRMARQHLGIDFPDSQNKLL